MSAIDSRLVVLTCGDGPPRHRLPFHGRRRPPPPVGVPTVSVPARPGRGDVDPVLADLDPHRIVVVGTDADLAAVLLRLLRTERLDVEVAYVPDGRSDVAAIWRLPSGDRAVELAVHGTAAPTPLVRDDTGGVLAGRGEVHAFTGECWCDDTLVLRGPTPRLVAAVTADGIAVRAGRGNALPDGRKRPVPPFGQGRGSSVGRAVQVGGPSLAVTADGVEHPRPLERRTWYRHTEDWRLVRP